MKLYRTANSIILPAHDQNKIGKQKLEALEPSCITKL